MSVTDRRPIVGERPWIVTALFLAATVHLVSILALPRLAGNDAFSRLTQLGAVNAFHALPRAVPGDELVFDRDPAMADGVCRFDLANGPLHVRGKLKGDNFVGLSFHSRTGVVFYALTDKGATDRSFDVFVLTADQSRDLAAKTPGEDSPLELRLVAPDLEGFVFARVLASRPSAYEDAQAEISAFNCAVEPGPNPLAGEK